MKITQESDYALRIIQFLSINEESTVGASIIADRQKVPLRFALKILRKLNAAGLTKAYRGVSGGYSLAKSPETISYKDVIVAIEGDIYLNKCIADKSGCTRDASEKCPMHKKLVKIQQLLDKELESAKFDDN